MNLRVIKKDIEYFVGEFIDDCSLFIALNPQNDNDEIVKLIDEAIELYNSLKDKVNHPEGSTRAYYNGIRQEMFDSLDKLCEKLSEAIVKNN